MKKKSLRPLVLSKPSENDISDYAFHLYEQSNCTPDRDVDNWFEAMACLKANIPAHQSGRRLHQHLNGSDPHPMDSLTHPVGSLIA